MQNASLPMLLDIANTPSYPPKSSQLPKRPATTNPKMYSTGPTGRKFSTGRVQTSQTQKRGYLQTATASFYDQGASDLKDPDAFFCFTELKLAPRPLKKLYTGPQHELLLKKRDNVKERFQRLYQNTNAEEPEVVAENNDNLKELVLGAEQVLSSTYSVKYFGLKDNQLGIVSKRIPIATFDEKSYQHARQTVLMSGKKSETGNQSKNTRIWTPNVRHSEPSPWRNSVMSSKCEEDLKSTSRPVTSPVNAKPKTYKDANEQVDEAVVSEKVEEENANVYLDIDNVSKVNSAGRNSVTRFPDTNLPPQPAYNEDKKHVITHYMIPRKLQSAKNGKKAKPGSNSQWEVLGNIQSKTHYNNSLNEASDLMHQKIAEERNRMWVKVFPEDQRVSNTADFERKVLSLEKTKRTLLRSVDVERAWEAKEPQSEIDVPSRFRTHEVNKVLSDTSKYSYSQLLKTMYTNERPETALVENTQKMERIISAREEKKMQKPKKSLRGITSAKTQKEYGGRYVIKVEYPKENKMLNQFIKIKTNVVNEQVEEM